MNEKDHYGGIVDPECFPKLSGDCGMLISNAFLKVNEGAMIEPKINFNNIDMEKLKNSLREELMKINKPLTFLQ